MVDKNSLKTTLDKLGLLSFEDLVTQYQHSVYSTAYSFTGNSSDAEDLAQEIFWLIYKNLHKFNFESKLSTWIYRITVNKCLSYRRDIARRKSIAEFVTIDNSETINLKDESNVEKCVIDNENDVLLRRAIHSMGSNYSVLIILKYYESLANKEIAKILGLPLRTVETRIYRAKKKLKKKLVETNYRWEVK